MEKQKKSEVPHKDEKLHAKIQVDKTGQAGKNQEMAEDDDSERMEEYYNLSQSKVMTKAVPGQGAKKD